ncbi:MAG: calcium/sodium antiporter [Eubacteriales bacterium]
MQYILLLLGFVLLIKGADYFVEGSSSVAKLMHIPTVIIGLTVVAFGTSLPELSVSLTASLQGANALAVGNVVGSNIFNVLIVLGVSSLIAPVKSNASVLKKEFPFSIIISVLLFLLMGGYNIMAMATPGTMFTLTRIGGFILLACFVWFIVSTVKDALKARGEFKSSEEVEEYEVLPAWKSAVFIVLGIAGIGIGGELVVNSASVIGMSFGMTESFVGLTIVALGTSLPELVTSVVAAKKGENDLALGNVVGSNIFNVLLILGSSAAISPITVAGDSMYDILIATVFSIAVFLMAKSKGEISKKEGAVFVLLYAVFFAYILMR